MRPAKPEIAQIGIGIAGQSAMGQEEQLGHAMGRSLIVHRIASRAGHAGIVVNGRQAWWL
ncbi:hypothetical protein GCM10011505_22360 [Tistrella bauzanensis]|uniref:Uncharacterized protein n=1 Tax=Tistrella bauzanensis TaxID=657419 RepID=A0ABQ1II02_9PROT|nr:hypothetical protein GCM10011505_22360 [Tistrella bauzanensis]